MHYEILRSTLHGHIMSLLCINFSFIKGTLLEQLVLHRTRRRPQEALRERKREIERVVMLKIGGGPTQIEHHVMSHECSY
jgi:hypothetical protein